DLDPSLLLCQRAEGEIAAVIGAVVRRATTYDSERTGFLKLIGVAPRWQRQRRGTRLLAEVESRLASAGVKTVPVFADSPSHLIPGVDYRLTDLVCLLERHGYETQWAVVNMAADLARAPLDTADEERRLINADVQISRLAPYDAEAFLAYLAAQWHWQWQVE